MSEQTSEVKNEVKVEKPIDASTLVDANKTETPAANLLSSTAKVETPAEEKISEFDIDLDEKQEPTNEGRVKFSKDRFKEVDDDLYSDEDDLDLDEKTSKLLDKVLSRTKEYKTKTNEYKTIAEANQLIGNDDYVKTWSEHLNLDNDQLIRSVEMAKYQQAGYSETDAAAKATESVEELKMESEKLFNRKAEEIRLDLRTAIKNRTTEIHSNISKTAKALSLSNAPDPTLISKATEKLSKVDNFLGLKIGGKTEQSKKDFTKPVEAAIKDGSLLKKIQSDPDLLAEIGLFVQYKDRFKSAIEKRTPSKKEVLERLSKAPHSSGAAPLQNKETVSKEGGLKNPGGFK